VLDDHRKLQLAADRLDMSQSAAARMLAEIEAVAGASLFERSARGLEPTALLSKSRSLLMDERTATPA